MDVEQKLQYGQNELSARDKNCLTSEYTSSLAVYNMEMTVSQANAISRLLPTKYSINIDRSFKPKRTIKRTYTVDSKSKEIISAEDCYNENVGVAKQEAVQTLSYSEMVKRCQKIIIALKKNKNSWPFLEPVDPIAMGIPHYKDIVTRPMDLKTVAANLADDRYTTISQFYSDIELIISNSLVFNKTNVDFCKITNDFKKCFDRLKMEPVVVGKGFPVRNERKGSMSGKSRPVGRVSNPAPKQVKSFLTIAEKKDLAIKIKSQPKDNIIEIAEIVSGGSVPENFEFNLETLTAAQLQNIQAYLERKEEEKRQLSTRRDERVDEAEESSFQSDSDS